MITLQSHPIPENIPAGMRDYIIAYIRRGIMDYEVRKDENDKIIDVVFKVTENEFVHIPYDRHFHK